MTLGNIPELPPKLDLAMANFLRRMKERTEQHSHTPQDLSGFATSAELAAHNHDATYAPIAKGVTNGDSHDHNGGDGAQIDHGSLGGRTDDDHTIYLKADGSRDVSGNLTIVQASSNVSLTLKAPKANEKYLLFKSTDANPFWYQMARSDTYNDFLLSYYNGTGYLNYVKVSPDGELVLDYQPRFLAGMSADIENLSTGNTTLTWNTEIIDVGGNFDGTYFNAPVTGHYFLFTIVRLQNVDTAGSYYTVKIGTSNRSYNAIMDPGKFSADVAYWAFSLGVCADMDSGDTANVAVIQGAGTAQTDVFASQTLFGGWLLG